MRDHAKYMMILLFFITAMTVAAIRAGADPLFFLYFFATLATKRLPEGTPGSSVRVPEKSVG